MRAQLFKKFKGLEIHECPFANLSRGEVDAEIIIPGRDPPTSQEQGSYLVSYQFEQFLRQSPTNPRDRWGLFFKATYSDGNPNFVSH